MSIRNRCVFEQLCSVFFFYVFLCTCMQCLTSRGVRQMTSSYLYHLYVTPTFRNIDPLLHQQLVDLCEVLESRGWAHPGEPAGSHAFHTYLPQYRSAAPPAVRRPVWGTLAPGVSPSRRTRWAPRLSYLPSAISIRCSTSSSSTWVRYSSPGGEPIPENPLGPTPFIPTFRNIDPLLHQQLVDLSEVLQSRGWAHAGEPAGPHAFHTYGSMQRAFVFNISWPQNCISERKDR